MGLGTDRTQKPLLDPVRELAFCEERGVTLQYAFARSDNPRERLQAWKPLEESAISVLNASS